MPVQRPQIEQTRLSDQAYQHIEELIVTLRLQPGSVVTEADVIRLTAIGRTPTREALQRLASQGLVTPLPRRGILINQLNLAQYVAVLNTRRVLDRLIATSAARKATRQQRQTLQRISATMRKAATRQDMSEFMRVDRELDQILEEAAQNPFAAHASAPLHIHCRRLWYTYRHDREISRAAKLHNKLITAVARGNESAAAKASDNIIGYLEEFTRKTIEV
ncbi:MAG: GntR family transcriptional regulator [Bacteroidetes bacterium]|nr:GntR family transcriptional regulator [Bacteroidota bacterium]